MKSRKCAMRKTLKLVLTAAVLPRCMAAAHAATPQQVAGRLEVVWRDRHLAGAAISAMVADCVSGRVVYQRQAWRPMVPASNEKLAVTAWALLVMGPDYRFRTTVYAGGPVIGGVIQGPLLLCGSADPTAGPDIFPSVAEELARRGIARCRGVWVNGPVTAAEGDSTEASRQRLAAALKAAELTIEPAGAAVTMTAAPQALMEHQSVPLAEIVARINKWSTNWLADNLFRSMGWLAAGDGDRAGEYMKAFWARRGVAVSGVVFADGSGLSRHNRATAAFYVDLLRYMYFSRVEWPAFAASLPVAGRDGTLAKRMVGTPAEGRVWAKTGTMHDICALSGYVQTVGGRLLCFSILMNDLSCGREMARRLADRACATLVELGE